ncbi:MAG: hypothetical protein CBC71_00435 [Rhodobacteraceae bacterium TMED111]|nr:hypothetical protein [Marinovum sp.]OUV45432.1 MAG: hypothetical protein CBC71_00435 [Rhodobacteraceae bacterium TMED111]|tara:strand:+ start:1243 stop:1437 length:195 start_codon:yes stop_codon:yes gene_type:complete
MLHAKLIVANLVMAGVATGAVGAATAIYFLSDPERREKAKNCADKISANCKKLLCENSKTSSYE